jgi:very-short-patch-repair endonuclease
MRDKAYTRPTTRARTLRANPTEAERRLWAGLSARGVRGVRFNRQVPIGPCICDFVARAIGLVIEVDGGQHAGSEADAERTRFLQARGYRVLRFWNDEVLRNMEGVVAVISAALADTPSPYPSRKREGDRPAAATAGRRSRQ